MVRDFPDDTNIKFVIFVFLIILFKIIHIVWNNFTPKMVRDFPNDTNIKFVPLIFFHNNNKFFINY